jgi:hypothetical protein
MMAALISASDRGSFGMIRRHAPTEPPNPHASSPPFPSCRSALPMTASSGLCSIRRAMTR